MTIRKRHGIVETEKRLIAKSKKYSWYIQFNGNVYRVPNSKPVNDPDFYIYHKTYIENNRAIVRIQNKAYDLMDLVLVSFSKYYRTRKVKTRPKDGNILNCHGDNINVLRTDLLDGIIRTEPKNLIGVRV